MPPSEVDLPAWPPVLRRSHWQKALGLPLRAKIHLGTKASLYAIPATDIGPAMAEAYKRFQIIQRGSDSQNKTTSNYNFYTNNIGPLVGTLIRINHLAVVYIDYYKSNSRFSRVAEEVAREALKLAETLRARPGGPHTPRSVPGSPVRSAGGSSSSGGAEAIDPEAQRRLVDKYKECWRWPRELTSTYYSHGMRDHYDGDETRIENSLSQMEHIFRAANWKIYEKRICDHDLRHLTAFYEKHISPLYSLLDRLEDAARVWRLTIKNKKVVTFEFAIPFLTALEEDAMKRKDLYHGCPGSIFTSAWEHEFAL